MPTLVIVRRPRTARSVTQTVRMRFLVGTGVVDLVHRTLNGWKIVDYKTDRDAAAMPVKCAGQIAEYERAWRRFVPEPVTAVLVSTRARHAGGNVNDMA